MKKLNKRFVCLLMSFLLIFTCLCACGSKTEDSDTKESAVTTETQAAGTFAESAEESQTQAAQNDASQVSTTQDLSAAPVLGGLTCTGKMDLQYAECFNIYYYDDGSKVIDIPESGQFLLIPEGGAVPESGAEGMRKLQMPLTKIYDAASSSLSLFSAMNALDTIRMVSVQESGWSYDSMKDAMKSGDIIFAGKYNEPDYETLINEGCQIAIESTMINQVPDVLEMIETLGIPVMVERSSYESNPLGRMEWIKLYGTLNDRLEDAEAYFDSQKQTIEGVENLEKTDLTVAFFYISADGKAVVRRSTDYIPAMIEMAGGNYVFKDLDDEGGRVAVDMGIETFFDAAKDADIVIYNGTIDSSVKTLEDLKGKNPVIAKIKAVQNNNVWITGSSVYQRADVIGDMILDFHRVIANTEIDQLQYLSKLE